MKLELERIENKNEELEVNGILKLSDTEKESIDIVFEILEQIETIGEKTYIDRLFINSEIYWKLEHLSEKIEYILYDIVLEKEE